MNSNNDENVIIDNNIEAGIFLSLFLLALDIIIFIVIFNLFFFDFKKLSSPIQKLFLFLILDGISRLIRIYINTLRKRFLQELISSSIAAIQFHLSLSMLEQVFTDQRNDSYMIGELQIRNKNLFSFLFFCLTFSFKGLLSSYGLLSSIQYIVIFVSISIFYKYINNKIDIYLTNIQKNNSQFTSKNLIINIPFFVFIYLGINYILKLFGLVFENKLYESYMSMICTIFKEVGKYLVIILMILIYNAFNKYVIKTSEHTYNSQPIKPVEKQKVQVYKDEDESVQL